MNADTNSRVQINKTADRMYALFAICNALSPSRVDDNILNVVKERYGEQLSKMSRGQVKSFYVSQPSTNS